MRSHQPVLSPSLPPETTDHDERIYDYDGERHTDLRSSIPSSPLTMSRAA